MGLNILTLGSSKTYTRESLLGGGAVVGKNVTISSITPIEGGNRVTFSYTLDNGTVKTSTMDVMDGIDGLPGKDGKDGLNGKDGQQGADGIGISKIEKIGTVDLVDTYRITFTDNSTFDYEVKNGADGTGGTGASTWSEISDKPFESLSTDFSVENGELKVVGGTGGGEENKIDSISVNGVNVSPDENKNVDITIPSLDGYAKSEEIPTKVSQLDNDSNYQTADDITATLAPYAKSADITKEITTEVTKVVADAPEEFDTLKEMSDWIYEHEDSAAAMNSAILQNKQDIESLQTGKADIESVNELNSNLDTLEYSEVAGGKNLFNGIISGIINAKFENGVVTNTYADSKTALSFQVQVFDGNTICLVTQQLIATENARNSVSLSIPSTTKVTKLRIKHNGSRIDIYIDFPFTKTGDFTISIYVSKNNPSVVGGLEFSDIQIEEGAQATPYEPYIPSVKMLAEENSTQNESLSVIGKCKNLLNPTLQTTTQNGVTCTNNGDGTYTFNGTSKGFASFILKQNINLDNSKNHRLTGFLSAFIDDCELQFTNSDGNNVLAYDRGEGVNLPKSTNNSLYFVVKPDKTLNNVIIKPMLTTNLNATYDDFVPYTGDGETLTHDVAELKKDLCGFKLKSGWFRYNVTQTNTDITMTDEGKYDGTFPTIDASTPIFFTIQGSSTNTTHKTHVYTDGATIKINTDVAQRYSIRWLTLA